MVVFDVLLSITIVSTSVVVKRLALTFLISFLKSFAIETLVFVVDCSFLAFF